MVADRSKHQSVDLALWVDSNLLGQVAVDNMDTWKAVADNQAASLAVGIAGTVAGTVVVEQDTAVEEIAVGEIVVGENFDAEGIGLPEVEASCLPDWVPQ